MQRKNKLTIILGVLILFIGSIILASCATTSGKAKTGAAITYDVCSSAKITSVSYFIKKYKGAPRLHIKIGIKNISKEPKRFRVKIFLSEGPSSGGFYPRKGKPPVIKPGKELSRTFPMYFSKFPSGFTIVVQEL